MANRHVIQGPSPRVRGSPVGGLLARDRGGSIPACAGKPGRCPGSGAGRRVHPRVCGEADLLDALGKGVSGPSPRVRGSRPGWSPPSGRWGSIPACAGKPPRCRARHRHAGVHPRVCGEARPGSPRRSAVPGPSPRVRGSHAQPKRRGSAIGSIPACAGKPSARRRCRWLPGVHPRVCGEAVPRSSTAVMRRGPSPRVRGSRRQRRAAARAAGSIPACAGKPPGVCPSRPAGRVHPRVCGEASSRGVSESRWTGPSPRVRGSRAPDDAGLIAIGSIPACAGKPGAPRCHSSCARVHPRVCGEA